MRHLLVLSTAVGLALAPCAARGDVPHMLGFQGRLLRSDGSAATGTATITFTVLDAETAGSALWTETQTLGLSDGYYSTFLGLVAAPPVGLFGDAARWLETKVGTEILAPRQRVGSVPFALAAQSVAGGSASVTSLSVGGHTVVDSAGRLAGTARYAAGPGVAVDDATQTISLQACPAGQVLIRGGTAWQCTTPAQGTVLSVGATAPLSVADASTAPQISIAQAGASSSGFLSSGDWTVFNARYGAATQCGGDLAGLLAAPVVAKLQSRPVSAAAPANGHVLKWNGSEWAPSPDVNSGGTVTSLTAAAPLTVWNGSTTPEISLLAASSSADGYLSSGDWTRFNAKYEASTQCGGDLTGALSSPAVARIRGVSVATSTPATAQVLRYDGSAWTPASLDVADVGGLSSGYLDLTGNQSITGAKDFISAPSFGTPLGTASGGTGVSVADTAAVFAGPADGSASAPGFRPLEASDIPPLDAGKISTGILPVANGGTGGSTGETARAGIGAAASGGNSDITSLSGLTTALSVGQGGTGGTTPSDARSGIQAAVSGANSDITSLSGLTTALSVAQGGTGAASFASGAILYGNSTDAVGASAGSAGQVLVSGGSAAPAWSASPTLSGANFSAIPESAVTGLATDLSNRPTGSGTAGYHARWTGASTLGASSLLSDDGTRVGIGTTGRGGKLDVSGVLEVGTGGRGAQLVSTASDNFTLMAQTNTPNTNWTIGTGNGAGTLDATKPYVYSNVSFISLMSGNVGIGTTTPGAPLHVSTSGALTAYFDSSHANGPYIALRESGANPFYIGKYSAVSGSGPAGYDLWSPSALKFHTGASATVRMLVDTSGKVGIGTTAPSEALQVSGNVAVSGWVAADHAPSEYLQEYTNDHCTTPDGASFMHIRTSINADSIWEPKYIEVKGFHTYGGEWVHDFKAVVNTWDGGGGTPGSFGYVIKANNGNSTPVFYRTNGTFNGARRVAFSVQKQGCCCVGRIWVKIFHGNGGKDSTPWEKTGAYNQNAQW